MEPEVRVDFCEIADRIIGPAAVKIAVIAEWSLQE